MSFGLTDFSSSNFDYGPKLNEKKGITQVNSDTDLSKNQDDSFDSNKAVSQKPLIQNDVKGYRFDKNSEPAMLDFGIFDYRNRQGNSIGKTLANKDFKQQTEDGFNSAMANVRSTSAPRTGGSHANFAMTEIGEGSAGLSTVSKMQQVIQQSKG